jgi:hypothetical protein
MVQIVSPETCNSRVFRTEKNEISISFHPLEFFKGIKRIKWQQVWSETYMHLSYVVV